MKKVKVTKRITENIGGIKSHTYTKIDNYPISEKDFIVKMYPKGTKFTNGYGQHIEILDIEVGEK